MSMHAGFLPKAARHAKSEMKTLDQDYGYKPCTYAAEFFVCFVSFLHLAANNALSDSSQESNKIHYMATIFFLITIFVLSPSTEHV